MQGCLPWDACFALGFCGFVCVDKCECPRGARMLMQACLPWDAWVTLGACLGALLWLCGLWLGWACSCLGGLALACLGACFGLPWGLLWLGVGLALAWCGVLGVWGVGVWGVALAPAPWGRLSFLRFALQTPMMIKSTIKSLKALPRLR